jgi:hypothetical protein
VEKVTAYTNDQNYMACSRLRARVSFPRWTGRHITNYNDRRNAMTSSCSRQGFCGCMSGTPRSSARQARSFWRSESTGIPDQSDRFSIFYGYAVYPADTRKANGSIDLWPIWNSDCRADTRKSNVHNDLCQSLILAKGDGACALVAAALRPMSGVAAAGTEQRGGALRPGSRRITTRSGQQH